MKIISLQSDPNFEFFKFGAGETQVKFTFTEKIKGDDEIFLQSVVRDGDDIMKILLAKDALDNMRFTNVSLVIPYIPYSRQDRICAKGEAFSLRVFANLINSANFSNVYVYDPHSEVSGALIKNMVVLSIDEYVNASLNMISFEIGVETDSIYIVSPDAGATKKVTKLTSNLYEYYSRENYILMGTKVRDVKTGKLSGFDVFVDDLEGRPCLIVDDICSYGGTFCGIAQKLKEKNAGEIYLFVTHYEGVADIKRLQDAGIKKIFTTNSMDKEKIRSTNFITKFDLF